MSHTMVFFDFPSHSKLVLEWYLVIGHNLLYPNPLLIHQSSCHLTVCVSYMCKIRANGFSYNAVELYVGGARFESWRGYRLS
jgi:hypothetical protein